jgi:hypothetical protein
MGWKHCEESLRYNWMGQTDGAITLRGEWCLVYGMVGFLYLADCTDRNDRVETMTLCLSSDSNQVQCREYSYN